MMLVVHTCQARPHSGRGPRPRARVRGGAVPVHGSDEPAVPQAGMARCRSSCEAIAWALAGCGFSLILLEWPKVFMVAWRKDVGMFLGGRGGLLGAVVYLFAVNLRAALRRHRARAASRWLSVAGAPLRGVAHRRPARPCVGRRQGERHASLFSADRLHGAAVRPAVRHRPVRRWRPTSAWTWTRRCVTLAVAAGAGVHVALALLGEALHLVRHRRESCRFCCCAAGFLAMALAGDAEWKAVMRPVPRGGVDLPRLRQHVGAHGLRQRARLPVLAHFARAVRHGGRHGHRLGRLPCR